MSNTLAGFYCLGLWTMGIWPFDQFFHITLVPFHLPRTLWHRHRGNLRSTPAFFLPTPPMVLLIQQVIQLKKKQKTKKNGTARTFPLLPFITFDNFMHYNYMWSVLHQCCQCLLDNKVAIKLKKSFLGSYECHNNSGFMDAYSIWVMLLN